MNMTEKLEKAREARKKGAKRGPVKQYIRSRDGDRIEVELTRSKAIKAMCTECCGFGEMHPKDCTDTLCPLYSFRGKIQLAYKSTEDIESTETDEDDDE